MLAACYADAGLPGGALNLVYGSGREVGDALVEDPRVAAVSFTGSNAIGVRLYEQCARRGARAQCEMGGKNPCIILEDADLDLAVGALLGGAFGATGQRCTAMSRAIVVEAVADEFLERLLARTAQLKVGPGLDEAAYFGPCVSESQMNSVLEYIQVGQKEGARLLCGGQRLTEGNYARGYFLPPTIFDDVTPGMRIAREEIFGPVLTIHRVPDFDAALEAANAVDYGLTSVIYTNDLQRALVFVDKIEAGMAHVNSPWLGGEVHLPFGGAKATGIGPREMGDEVLDFYTETKAVYINYSTPKRG
jgi:aldehyde dehydrogenase (NAD+)